jgi:hypothetical protein
MKRSRELRHLVSMILKLHFKDKMILSKMIVEIPSEKGHGSKMEERKREVRRGFGEKEKELLNEL